MSKHAPSGPRPSVGEPLTRILSPRLLEEVLGLSAATIWRMRRRGELPDPIRLSPGRCGWRAADIEQWLDRRAEAASK